MQTNIIDMVVWTRIFIKYKTDRGLIFLDYAGKSYKSTTENNQDVS